MSVRTNGKGSGSEAALCSFKSLQLRGVFPIAIRNQIQFIYKMNNF